MKETFKQAGYKYGWYVADSGTHVLLNTHTGLYELFVSSKGYAGWGLTYKNTHLEFVAGS